MLIELSFWQCISLAISFLGFALGAGKILFYQFEKRQTEIFADMEKRRVEAQQHWNARFARIEEGQQQAANEWTRLERSLLELKAELPLQYVRREDYVRGQAVLEAKMDALYSKLEVLLTRGSKND
jgi:hypothetical protein